MSERRQETRRKLMTFTPVYDVKQAHLLGYLADLTLKGARIVGETAVEVGQETTLGIEFPKNMPEVKKTRITLPIRFAWCHQDDSPSYFNIGVTFITVTSEQSELFTKILSRYRFREDVWATPPVQGHE